MTPRLASTSAWLSCNASPFEGYFSVGRHFEPVASEITFHFVVVDVEFPFSESPLAHCGGSDCERTKAVP